MTTWRGRHHHARALRALMVGLSALVAASACSSGERAQRDRDMAALRSQIEEIRRGLDANTKDVSRLSGEMKALDAQTAFVIGEVKASAEERAKVKGSIEDTSKAIQALQSAVDGLQKSAATAGPSAVAVSFAPDATAEQ